jgi:hypothetical protein
VESSSSSQGATYGDLVMDDGGSSTYRSLSLRLGFILVVGCLAVLGVWLVRDHLAAGRPGQAVVTGAGCLAVAAIAVELLWRPAVVVSAAGVALVNPFRTTFVPWELLVDTEAADGLRLLTADWHYRSWAASGGLGVGHTWSAGRALVADNPMGVPFGMGSPAGPGLRSVLAGGARPGHSPAKILVDQAWQAWQGTSHENHEQASAVVVTWHRLWTAVALMAVAVAALAAIPAR